MLGYLLLDPTLPAARSVAAVRFKPIDRRESPDHTRASSRRPCYFLRMHDAHKHDYLAQAERHIVIAQDHIARQKRIIDELTQAGHETDCAVSMLHALETCLHAFEHHYEMILERCKT
jgi:hypothetical protein